MGKIVEVFIDVPKDADDKFYGKVQSWWRRKLHQEAVYRVEDTIKQEGLGKVITIRTNDGFGIFIWMSMEQDIKELKEELEIWSTVHVIITENGEVSEREF